MVGGRADNEEKFCNDNLQFSGLVEFSCLLREDFLPLNDLALVKKRDCDVLLMAELQVGLKKLRLTHKRLKRKTVTDTVFNVEMCTQI